MVSGPKLPPPPPGPYPPAPLPPPPGSSKPTLAEAKPDDSGAPPGSSTALPKVCPTCLARYPADFRVCPRDASPLGDAPDQEHDPLLGATLGDAYQIVRVIGEGGMGRVYEARHTRLGNKRFAIKMLHAEYARQPDVVARFQREAEAASGISHPNVVGVYDVHRTVDGRPYLVGEFLEGEEFGDFLHKRGRIDAALAVRIVRQICRALGAAHANGVVHRDMKPENVFLVGAPDDPAVKVIDFGISKVGDAGGTALTRTGMIMGTPSYMAPEQARGEKVDHRADVYAVGGILYRALTGRKPFDNDDPSMTLTQVLTEDPVRPRSIEPSIPEALEMVVQRAMAKEPSDRYASMADLDADLAPFDPAAGVTLMDAVPPIVLGAKGGADAAARTLLASPPSASGSQTQMMRATREIKRARPTIVLLTLIGYAWVLAGLIDALAGAVRMLRGTASNVTRPEAMLITLGSVAATVTPLMLWVRQLAKWWGNSLRAVQLADRMRRVLAWSVATSATLALAIRIVEGAFRNEAHGIAWPVWSVVLFVASIGAGVLAYLPGRKAK
jgi:serine/threonine protein kinase